MIPQNMYPAQSITATGKLASISVDMMKFGSPVFNVRAKIYSYIPANFESGYPLPAINFVGQSTNVIAAAGLTAGFVTQTFLFNNLSVTGQWLVLFTYETETLHDSNNYVQFAVGVPDLYGGGDFIYYDVLGDNWSVLEFYDMIFTCVYCNEGASITTTTTTGVCIEYIMICTTRGEQAQFTVVHCGGSQETITVDYDQPQVLCLSQAPTVLDLYGLYEQGRQCEATTTTTTTNLPT